MSHCIFFALSTARFPLTAVNNRCCPPFCTGHSIDLVLLATIIQFAVFRYRFAQQNVFVICPFAQTRFWRVSRVESICLHW
jgi:hypothetical protein